MSTSELQRQVSSSLSVFFGGYTIRENTRPDWLQTPQGERLELDFLIEELNVAIEVQGAQHYAYVPHFHADYEAYKNQTRRDEWKKITCERAGIKLYEVADPEQVIEAVSGIYSLVSSGARGYFLVPEYTPGPYAPKPRETRPEPITFPAFEKRITPIVKRLVRLMLRNAAYGGQRTRIGLQFQTEIELRKATKRYMLAWQEAPEQLHAIVFDVLAKSEKQRQEFYAARKGGAQ